MTQSSLRRELGLWGAVGLGLGSILGTGVFVSLGLAAAVAGEGVLLAIPLAGFLALGNALGSAQLAAAYPVSGGAYEYGYRLLSPSAGRLAGWSFLLAKSASAAAALLALGSLAGVGPALAIGILLVLTALVVQGVRRSNAVNACLVTFILGALAFFVAQIEAPPPLRGAIDAAMARPGALLEATALAFVAYTGYGRLATMGEEVRDPTRTIPRAILTAMFITVAVYALVAWAAIDAVGVHEWGELAARGAGLGELAALGSRQAAANWLFAAAIAALIGVVLNLLLGLSRMALAMARRGDLPSALMAIDGEKNSPRNAVYFVAALILAFVAVGSLKGAWAFSAASVLLYYAINNLAAFRLPPDQRRYPRIIAAISAAGCVLLAPALGWQVGLLVLGAVVSGAFVTFHVKK